MTDVVKMRILWPGPSSSFLLDRIINLIIMEYPLHDNIFVIARDLEEDIRELLCANNNVIQINNRVLSTCLDNSLEIKFVIKSGGIDLFPNALMIGYGLDPMSQKGVDLLFDIIVDTLRYHSKLNLSGTIVGEMVSRFYIIKPNFTSDGKNVSSEQFGVLTERLSIASLGVFLYLLHMRKRFENRKDVCIIISDLEPLIKRVKQIEEDLVRMKYIDFLTKYKVFDLNEYDILKKLFEESSTTELRYTLLCTTLEKYTPYLMVNNKNKQISIVNSKAFEILMNRCKMSGARYTITYLLFRDYYSKDGHANIVIIDRELGTIERYEPNGYVMADTGFNNSLGGFDALFSAADDYLYSMAKAQGYKYYPPTLFCPQLGAQTIEYMFKEDGFCVTWSLLYAIERIETNASRDDIANNFITTITLRYNLDGDTYEDTIANIEKFIKHIISEIYESLESEYKKLSAALNTKLRYENGKLIYQIGGL